MRLTEEHKRKISDYRKGKPTNLGMKWKLSDEQKAKLSKIRKGMGKGRKLSEEHKLKISKRMSGDRNPMKKLETRIKMSNIHKAKGVNHHSWRGGVSTQNEIARKSQKYRLWRESVFRRDDYTCQHCGIRPQKGTGIKEKERVALPNS